MTKTKPTKYEYQRLVKWAVERAAELESNDYPHREVETFLMALQEYRRLLKRDGFELL